jgi:2-hydroxymuconate-semialdehyde hydrolase
MTSDPDIAEITIPTGGYATHAYRAGEGNDDAVLLLHGGGPGAQAWSNWQPTLALLGGRFDVVAPDLLGFGTTDHPDPPPYGPRRWLEARCEQLVGVLDELDIARADLVGNSLGGALTLHMAIRHPDRVRRIVLMGSGGAPFTPGPQLRRMLGFYADPTARNLRAILGDFVFDLEVFGDIDELVDARVEVAPVECSRWLFERLQDAELHLFSRCGHWAMLEKPEAFARVVAEFLGRRVEVTA